MARMNLGRLAARQGRSDEAQTMLAEARSLLHVADFGLQPLQCATFQVTLTASDRELQAQRAALVV